MLGDFPNPHIRFHFNHSISIRHDIYINRKIPSLMLNDGGYSSCSETANGQQPTIDLCCLNQKQQRFNSFPSILPTTGPSICCVSLPISLMTIFPPAEKDCPSISVWDCTRLWNLGLDINGAASVLFDTNPLTNLCIQVKNERKKQLLLHTTDYCCAVFWHQLLALLHLLSASTTTQNSYTTNLLPFNFVSQVNYASLSFTQHL